MNVYITSTPELSEDEVREVIDVLNETKGPIIFQFSEILSAERVAKSNPKFNDLDSIQLLTFDELFNYCETNRMIFDFSDDAFVVVLTSYENNKEWFSCFNNRNIFVHTSDWDKITNHDSKYCVAHQIVENIFQSLIDLNVNDVENEPNIHQGTTGCINDYCNNEEKVLVKFKSADICDSCDNIAKHKNISNEILSQLQSILEKLRLEFKSFKIIKEPVKPQKITVDIDGNTWIGDILLDLDPIHLTLFLFFLINNNKKFKHKDLDDYSEIFINIYSKFIKNSTTYNSPVESIINNKKSFTINKSKLKKQLIKKLGKELAEHYLIKTEIDGSNSKNEVQYYYQINLPSDLIEIDSNFKKLGLI